MICIELAGDLSNELVLYRISADACMELADVVSQPNAHTDWDEDFVNLMNDSVRRCQILFDDVTVVHLDSIALWKNNSKLINKQINQLINYLSKSLICP